MKISSKAFNNGESIPSKFTCEGQNISPELHFEDIPPQTVSLVLIVDDPDAPKTVIASGVWDHWIVFNMPKETSIVKEGEQPQGIPGKNSASALTYTGPCPPDREHRYFFKLYALNNTLNLPKGPTKHEVEDAMRGHIIAEAVLMGRYDKLARVKAVKH